MSEVTVKLGDDGVWYCRHYIGTDAATGRRIRPYRKFPAARDEAEAREMAEEWLGRVHNVYDRHRVTMRLGSLLEIYVGVLKGTGSPVNTVRSYQTMLGRYIEPYIGEVDADELTPSALEHLYGSLLEGGRSDGGPLAPATVIAMHSFLSGAYRWMMRSGLVEANPVAAATKPRPVRHEAAALDGEDVRALESFLLSTIAEGAHDSRREVKRETALAALIALRTGARCGEVLALTRGDLRPSGGNWMLAIRGTVVETRSGAERQDMPKSKSSVRNVALDSFCAGVIMSHMAWQDDGAGRELPKETPICGGVHGFMRPTKVSSRFSAWAEGLQLPEGTTFHTLRHTHATMLLDNGVHMRTICERLGHSKVTTTMELYSHRLEGRDREAADVFERIGGGAS